MKNKLYYFLILFYLFMVGIILYINGVFTGDITSLSNLLINLVFLLVIGILFLLSCISFSRLNRCTGSLMNAAQQIRSEFQEKEENCLWESYSSKEQVFGVPVLDAAFQKYQKRMKSYQTKKGLTGSCKLEDYINEDLLDQIAKTYFNSAISSTLTGLGILGTFLGLSIGLGSFSGNDIYTISDNVGPLLGGMKVAFHTSVYGIFLSLVFNFVYRSIMSDAYDKLSYFHSAYRECVMPQIKTVDETLQTMLFYQANMAHSMKTISQLMEGNAASQMKGVEQIVKSFLSEMQEALGSDFDKLGRTLQHASDAQELYARNYETMEVTTKELLEASRILHNSLEQTLDQQEYFAKELRAQGEKLSDTCDNMSAELSSQLYTYQQMRDSYEK